MVLTICVTCGPQKAGLVSRSLWGAPEQPPIPPQLLTQDYGSPASPNHLPRPLPSPLRVLPGSHQPGPSASRISALRGGPSSSWGIVADSGLRAQMLFPELQGPEKLPDAPRPVVPWEFPELRGRFPVPPAPAPPLGTTPLAQAPGRNLHVDQGPLQTKQAHASPASLLHDLPQGRAQNQRAAPGRAPPCRLWGPGR